MIGEYDFSSIENQLTNISQISLILSIMVCIELELFHIRCYVLMCVLRIILVPRPNGRGFYHSVSMFIHC